MENKALGHWRLPDGHFPDLVAYLLGQARKWGEGFFDLFSNLVSMWISRWNEIYPGLDTASAGACVLFSCWCHIFGSTEKSRWLPYVRVNDGNCVSDMLMKNFRHDSSCK